MQMIQWIMYSFSSIIAHIKKIIFTIQPIRKKFPFSDWPKFSKQKHRLPFDVSFNS
jgi:hypothetical protein